MNISDVKIRKIADDSSTKLKAIVSITIDGEFVVHDIKIIDGVDRLFCAMPNRRSEDGRFQDIAHPISSEARAQIESAIFRAYEDYVSAIKEVRAS